MCLVTKQKRAKITKEEMRVYKFLHRNAEKYYSPYQDKQWLVGKLEKTKIKRTNDEEEMGFFDKKAINNYKAISQFSCRADEILYCGVEGLIFYKEGFHFALTAKRLMDASINKEDIYEFIIPKGARYYLDETGLGVTNKIIMAPIK